MTSFVTDVLLTAAQVELSDLNGKITEIQNEIQKLKDNVKESMEEKFVTFLPKLSADQVLVNKAEKLMSKMSILQERVENQIKSDLSVFATELKTLSNNLQEANFSLEFSRQLLELNEYLKSVENNITNKEYIQAARTLMTMKDLLDNPNSDLKDLDIFRAIRNNYSMAYGDLIADVMQLWRSYIFWQEKQDCPANLSSITLSIKCEAQQAHECMQALQVVEKLSSCLKNFSEKLIEHLISPIVQKECSVHVTNERIFAVETLGKKKPIYQSVLHNLKLLFQFLHQRLSFAAEDGQSFMNNLQGHLLSPLSRMLVRECMAETIPRSSAELLEFGPVVDDFIAFQDYLVEIGFISSDQLFLSKFTKNVNDLFIDKISKDYLVKARVIMKKDLHESIKYESEAPHELSEEVLENYDFKGDRKLSQATFHLPPCQISKSVKEVLELARELLEEACRNSDEGAVRLFYTSRNVIEMYIGLVPHHHKKFLETIPQQVALFHNNCMYLAHHLLTLAHEYKEKLPEILKTINVTYADQTLVLRSVGSEIFLQHMRYQRNIIVDILKDSGLSALGHTPELPPSIEKAMRQCIRQLELLKTVWHNVLPENIYCRVVGCIMNSMVDELIMKVITVEDIPAGVATELVTVFDMFVKRAPSIFPDPNTIQRHVKRWQKLMELIKMLGASLIEIDDRWADGKGPLAHEFKAAQVKQLIRALFQNTDRRSMLLAKIKG